MKVIIQKPDLDTCLTALILRVGHDDEVVFVRGDASTEDLNDPMVLCIEAGGSGETGRNNFDHHDPQRYYPPACRQAYEYKGLQDDFLNRLVEYVCMVDERNQEHPPVPFPSLSNIFSGMLLCERKTVKQFWEGLKLLDKVLTEKIDPFGTMPDLEEWRAFGTAKKQNMDRLNSIYENAGYYQSLSGKKVCFSESEIIGGIGALYHNGCEVAIMLNNAFGDPPVRKYTIAGNGVAVSHLLAHFNALEPGWGGRETIIGSPRTGSTLDKDTVIDLTIRNL